VSPAINERAGWYSLWRVPTLHYFRRAAQLSLCVDVPFDRTARFEPVTPVNEDDLCVECQDTFKASS
jgi:hypothetical protein